MYRSVRYLCVYFRFFPAILIDDDILQANVFTDAILWGRLPAGRRAATGSRLGRKTHHRTSIPKTIAVAVVINVLVHPTTDHSQTGWRYQRQQVSSRQAVGEFTQEKSTTVVSVRQPEIYDDHGSRTYSVHACRANCQAEFRKCAQTGWSRAGRVSTAELLDHCQWRLQPRRLCAVRLATVIHSTPSTGREARELPRIRFRYTVTPAKREWFFRHHCHRYFAHGLHGILQIPKTQYGADKQVQSQRHRRIVQGGVARGPGCRKDHDICTVFDVRLHMCVRHFHRRRLRLSDH